MNNTTKYYKKFIYPKDFKGDFQCDGFDGYEAAFKTRNSVQIVNCMAHIRRHFEQTQKTPSAQSLWAERTTCSVATMK